MERPAVAREAERMERGAYDVVIVGARCAGAAVATWLGRAGARVLMVDKSPLPSDQVLSTHTLHPAGVRALDELGVGNAMRAGCPEMPRFLMRKAHALVSVPLAPGRGERCPRRGRLDGLLQRAASEAGVEVVDRARVTELVFHEGRVVGLRISHDGGSPREVRAKLVIGADGRSSTVAAAASAEEYLGYDAPRAMFWGYWDAAEVAPEDRAMYVGHMHGNVRVVFHTDGGQVLVGCIPPVEVGLRWRADPLRSLREALARDPVTAPFVEREPDGKVRGFVKGRYGFRRGAGPGWLLLGDAGIHKDFVTGDGMTEALLQAKSAAAAILDGTDAALTRWWRERDVEALPWFFFGVHEGALGERLALEGVALERVADDPKLALRLTSVLERELSPYDLVPKAHVLSWVLSGVVRGRAGLLRDFVAMARRGAAVERQIRIARRAIARDVGRYELRLDPTAATPA